MKRYKIKYMNSNSQVDYHTIYVLGEKELDTTLIDIVNKGNYIEWVGERDERDTIGRFWEINRFNRLRKLNIFEINRDNEDMAYKEWGL